LHFIYGLITFICFILGWTVFHDDQRVAVDLCDLDDDDDDDGLAHYCVSSWFETCRTTLDMLGEILSLDDIVLGEETTQTSESCGIDEAGRSTCCRKRHR
jgi:hypothetical protein